MAARKYPVCEECGDEINPMLYEDCGCYYINNGRVLCAECFRAEIRELLEHSPATVAEMIGAAVVEL